MVEHNNSEIAPCKVCGAECLIDVRDTELIKGTFYFCSNAKLLGGNCLDAHFYMSVEAWNTRQPPSDAMRRAVGEECARLAYIKVAEAGSHTIAGVVADAIRALTQGKPDAG